MAGDIFLSLFIAIPIVALTAAFVYHMAKRREDIDRMDHHRRDDNARRVEPSGPMPRTDRLDRAR